MKISVAIPFYNAATSISEVLDAILAQSCAVDEIVLVDDGSVDDTVKIITENYLHLPHIKMLHQENGGCEAARAAAIEACSGDWIAGCDSDDIWHANHIERLLALHNTFPDANCLVTNFREVGNFARFPDKFASMPDWYWGAESKRVNGFELLGTNYIGKILEGNPLFPSCWMFTRELYDKVGGIRDRCTKVRSGDLDLVLRFSLAGTLACDHEISVSIIKHGDNVSHFQLKTLLGRIRILSFCRDERGIFEPVVKDIENRISRYKLEAFKYSFWKRKWFIAVEMGKNLSWAQLGFLSSFKLVLAHIMMGLAYLFGQRGDDEDV